MIRYETGTPPRIIRDRIYLHTDCESGRGSYSEWYLQYLKIKIKYCDAVSHPFFAPYISQPQRHARYT